MGGLWNVVEELLMDKTLLFFKLLLFEGEEDRNCWMMMLSNLDRGIV